MFRIKGFYHRVVVMKKIYITLLLLLMVPTAYASTVTDEVLSPSYSTPMSTSSDSLPAPIVLPPPLSTEPSSVVIEPSSLSDLSEPIVLPQANDGNVNIQNTESIPNTAVHVPTVSQPITLSEANENDAIATEHMLNIGNTTKNALLNSNTFTPVTLESATNNYQAITQQRTQSQKLAQLNEAAHEAAVQRWQEHERWEAHQRWEEAQRKKEDAGPHYVRRYLRVTATAYNSVPWQTSSHPYLGAWNDRLVPGMKAIAVSWDLLHIRGIGHETKVRISGLPGEYTVLDKMNPEWYRRIDIYMGNNIQAARDWGKRAVTISWLQKVD